ncbi:cytoskeleton-associated protein 2 [Mugil cephalus]|uniref:cytoskeleton-associated protein 2 n=1 Tax=Mugil cephalus TaxID=48193 RepID=UPI001FB652A8|nr:cytoskeleton-associated protein 2 [Mugil cephalus]
MDSVAVSRRNHTNKKGNKENTQPPHGTKSFIKGQKTTVVPFQLKGNKKEETLPKNDLKAKPKQQADTRSTSAVALKNIKPLQRQGRAAAAGVKQKQTHTQAFLSEQAVRHAKIAAEAPKPPVAVSSLKAAPGMYKGKIIQSKIGSIWKSSSSLCSADLKPSAPKTEKQAGNVAKPRSKSVTDMPGHSTQRPVAARSKSVVDRSAPVSKPPTTSRPPARYCPPTRTVPATLTGTRNATVAPTKVRGTLNSKPKVPVTDKKVNKPPASSTLSQYRFNVETAEERRAKLAEWMASKGKTFKRPAMAAAAAPAKTKAGAKPAADVKPQSEPEPQAEPEPEPQTEVQLAAHCQPEAGLEGHELDSAAQCADMKEAEPPAHGQTPVIMNTTLDLLENSDADLSFEPQEKVDDIVVNLCEALEAMSTLSECRDELAQVTDECNDVEMEGSKACEKEELNNEVPEEVVEEPKTEEVKDEAEWGDDQKVEPEEEESDDECVMETTPQIKDASVIKYSVKTTPYLQSVKKTIEGEVCASGSRRKSNIKDLKFLTPVRRSCRIQRKSSCLPTMLTDHDPCVSSLAELVTLDDDPNAYIYRKNTALLEDLPDKPRL